jgi:RNA polymerase sigma factor (TIGR02999 family)
MADMADVPGDLTRLLQQGDLGGEVLGLVYAELRQLAARRMAGERAGHTLQATALVHEAYVRLVRDRELEWRDRRHFFGGAAEAMRRVLIDHARKVQSEKRGGDRARLEISLGGLAREDDPELLLALDEALTALEAEDPRSAEVARLRFFAGLSVEDVSLALSLAPRTVARDWAFARARLTQWLAPEE